MVPAVARSHGLEEGPLLEKKAWLNVVWEILS
jgi:hypothetical protein